MTEETRISFLHCSQTAISTVTMPIEDDCLGATEDTESPVKLWNDLREKYSVSAETTEDIVLR